MRIPTAAVFALFLCFAGTLLAQEAAPLALLELEPKSAFAAIPEPTPEQEAQFETLTESGVTKLRIALVRDPERYAVPVFQFEGDAEKMNATLEDPTSPLRLVMVPIGEPGNYQMPTSEKNPLAFRLHRAGGTFTFAPATMPEAVRTGALGAKPMLTSKQPYAAMLQVDLPDGRSDDWVLDVLKQNRAMLGEDLQDDFGFSMISEMMAAMVGEVLKPLEAADQLAIGAFTLPSGHRVLDFKQLCKEQATAERATAIFNQEASASGQLQRHLARTGKSALRAKAVQDGKAMSARYVWAKGDDEAMMESFGMVMTVLQMTSQQKEMTPSTERVPTQRGMPAQFSETYDPQALMATLPDLLKEYIWFDSLSFGRVKGYLDPIHAPDTIFARGTILAESLLTDEDVDVYKPKESRFPPRPKDFFFTPPRIAPIEFEYDKEKGTPVTAKLACKVVLPTSRTSIAIPVGTTPGEEFTEGDYTVYVDQFENDVIALEAYNNAVNRPVMFMVDARDVDGNPIVQKGMGQFPARFGGTVDRLTVHIPSQSMVTNSFALELPVTPYKLKEPDEAPRVRYAKGQVTPFAPFDPTALEGLAGTWERKRFNLELPMPFDYDIEATAKAWSENGPMDVRVSAFGQPTSAMISVRPKNDDEIPLVLEGHATLAFKTGGRFFEVEKTGDKTTFDVDGKEGTLTFDRNQVTLLTPEGVSSVMVGFIDAEGRQLASSAKSFGGKPSYNAQQLVYGIPTHVLMYATTGIAEGQIPLVHVDPSLDEASAAALKAKSSESDVVAKPSVNELKKRAKDMYVAAFADALDAAAVGFPSDEYGTATAYIKALTGQGAKPGNTPTKVLTATPGWFIGLDEKPAENWDVFGKENHTWCFVPGFDITADAGVPFVFSSNLLNDTFGGEVKLKKGGLLGNQVVVGVHGGGATILDGSDADFWQKFDQAGSLKAGHKFLRP